MNKEKKLCSVEWIGKKFFVCTELSWCFSFLWCSVVQSHKKENQTEV